MSNIPAGASFQYQAQGTLPFSNPAIQGVISQLSINLQSSDSIMITGSTATGSGLTSSIAQAFNPFSGPEFEIKTTWFNMSGVDLDSFTIQSDIDDELLSLTGNPVISSLTGITQGTGTETEQQSSTVQNADLGIPVPKLNFGSGSVVLIAVVVILVVALVFAPETPARVVRSFAA